MKQEEKSPRRRSAKPAAGPKAKEPRVEVSGGVEVNAANVEITGDVVGRDQIVHGDKITIDRRKTIVSLPRGVALAVGGVAVVAAIVLVALVWPQLFPSGPALPEAAEAGEFLVVITQFDNPQGKGPEVGDRLRRAMKDRLQGIARVEDVSAVPKDRSEVIAWGNQIVASIVVWGTYDEAGLLATVEVLDSPFLRSVAGGEKVVAETSVDIPETVNAHIKEAVAEIAPPINYLALYTAGQADSRRADILRDAGKKAEALTAYDAALSLYDLASREIEGLAEDYQKELGVEKLYFARGTVHLNLADNGSDASHWEAAVQDLQHALALQPDFAPANFNLGYVYQQGLLQLDAALAQFDLVVQSKGAAAERLRSSAFDSIGVNYYYRYYFALADNKPDEAAAHLDVAGQNWQKAVDANPQNASALSNLGEYHYLKGDYASAIERVRAALEANPDDREPILELKYTCNLARDYLANSDSDQARQTYDVAIAQAAANPSENAQNEIQTCVTDLNDLRQKRSDVSAAADAILEKLNAAVAQPAAPEATP